MERMVRLVMVVVPAGIGGYWSWVGVWVGGDRWGGEGGWGWLSVCSVVSEPSGVLQQVRRLMMMLLMVGLWWWCVGRDGVVAIS